MVMQGWLDRQDSLWYMLENTRQARLINNTARERDAPDQQYERYRDLHFKLIFLPERGYVKRPDHSKENKDVKQDFDPGKFSFNKARAGELLFAFDTSLDRTTPENMTAECSSLPQGVSDVVIITVTPNDVGHVLLLPEVLQNHTQVLTESAVTKAVLFQLSSRDPSWRVGFNGRRISVNKCSQT
jgi:hypothetical protein